REGVGWGGGAVRGEHELRARPFTQWVLGHLRLELADEIGVTAKSKVGVDPFLDHREPQLLEARDLTLCEGLVRNVCQGGSTPQGERGSQPLSCLGRAALHERVPSLGEEMLAPGGV